MRPRSSTIEKAAPMGRPAWSGWRSGQFATPRSSEGAIFLCD